MAGLSKLYFGYFAEMRSAWEGLAPGEAPPEDLLNALAGDGITLLAFGIVNGRVRIVLESEPSISPAFLTQRLKGRVSYSLKQNFGDFPGFTRHFFLRSLGQNTRKVVAHYIEEQVGRSDLVDPLYRERLEKLRFREDGEVPEQKTRHRGVYDLFAHLVLVTGDRYRMSSAQAGEVFGALVQAVKELEADPMEVSMMSDHAHLLLRWPAKLSAAELLQKVQRESGRLFGRGAFWSSGGYVGTVGAYRLGTALEASGEMGWRRLKGKA